MQSTARRSLQLRRYTLYKSIKSFICRTLDVSLNADKFETGLLALIHEGGETDTYTSLAGSLLGAKLGFNAIPVNHLMV
jgi:ADP-ribosylglycohydrolase